MNTLLWVIKGEELKVCAVIVTYGDRFHLLKQVIEACFREEVDKVIVVDNASVENSRKQLLIFEERNKDKLKVIYLDENTGSANGFKIGFKKAFECKKCEYILALDDDNIIPYNSLNTLNNLFEYLKEHKQNTMLAMYRPIWQNNYQAIYCGDIKTQNIKPNNFMGFNFTNYLKHWYKKLFNLKCKKLLRPLQPIMYNEMGGIIFHKSILNKIGYPDEKFYLYTDDIEFTYRFVKNGGKIFVCSELVVNDIDITYGNEEGKKISYFDEEFSEFKMYYLLRNRAYFSKQFITNKLFFYGNGLILFLLFTKNIFRTPPNLFFKRFRIFLKAVHDGLNDKMGKVI